MGMRNGKDTFAPVNGKDTFAPVPTGTLFELSKLIEKSKMAAELLLATELAPEIRFVTCILLKYSASLL
jgi:hypothetical protein